MIIIMNYVYRDQESSLELPLLRFRNMKPPEFRQRTQKPFSMFGMDKKEGFDKIFGQVIPYSTEVIPKLERFTKIATSQNSYRYNPPPHPSQGLSYFTHAH